MLKDSLPNQLHPALPVVQVWFSRALPCKTHTLNAIAGMSVKFIRSKVLLENHTYLCGLSW